MAKHNRPLQLLMLISFALGMCLFNVEAFWQPKLHELLAGNHYQGYGYLAFTGFVMAALGPALYGALCRNIQASLTAQMIVIFFMIMGGLVWLGVQQNIWGFCLAYLLLMLLVSLLGVPAQLMVNQHSRPDQHASVFSIMSLLSQCGGALSSFALSPLIERWGVSAIWVYLGMGMAVIMLVWSLFRLMPWHADIANKSRIPPR